MFITIMFVVMVLLLIGMLPRWPYSSSWGYVPSGLVGLLLVFAVATLVMA